MGLILSILSAIALIILLSATAEKPIDPVEELKKELKNIYDDMSEQELEDCIKQYKETFGYASYELKKAYYELGQAVKETFNKRGK